MGVQCGAARADCDAIFNWHGDFGGYAEERRLAAAFTRSAVVEYGRAGDALPNPPPDHFVLKAE
jgi:hypothetical protein